MIKILKRLFPIIFLFFSYSASAQTTSSSPYSQFGLGNIKGPFLPQNRAMGDISAGLRRVGLYSNINVANPASYSNIKLTTFDIGAFGGITQLSNTSITQKSSFNGALSHIVFAIPVNKQSALSFGLLPYSDFGYKYRNADSIISNGSTVQTNYIYSGNGGISKAYIGYGFQIGKHISLGFNASYLFGKLSESSSTEFPSTTTFINSRTEKSNSIGGLNYDYGLQYYTNLSAKSRLTVGYSGSSGNKINSSQSSVTTRYFIVDGQESTASDTTFFTENGKSKIKMPASHTVGFTFERGNKWLLGADFSYNNWSSYRVGSVNPNLQNSYGVAVGGQYTPDITAIASKYFSIIDYRLGFKYNKTAININNTDIETKAITFGFGFPLQPARTTFYKINFSAELGQRGTLNNNLIRERYINFNLGFTLNDQWFQKFKFD